MDITDGYSDSLGANSDQEIVMEIPQSIGKSLRSENKYITC